MERCIANGRIHLVITENHGASYAFRMNMQVASASGAHLGVACVNIPFTGDRVEPWRCQESIIREPLRLEDGLFYSPDKPGLGVTPNWDVIARWRARP